MKDNFLIKQYKKDSNYKIKHSYLREQFSSTSKIFQKIKKLTIDGDYTLGRSVIEFENKIKKMLKVKYCLGVGSGTDAIFLSLKSLNINQGDEVITAPFTFYATVGAIATAGCKPVFADIDETLNIDPNQIEKKITKKTKAIVIVHWSGYPCEMTKIMKISRKYKIPVIEDACHGIKAQFKNQFLGTFGYTGCFSMHPLKNLNVWGDGGFLVTNSAKTYKTLKLLRNHGLIGRDSCKIYGFNSRLDSIQAIVANHLIEKLNFITNKRIKNAKIYNKLLQEVNEISLPYYNFNKNKHVFHLYQIIVKKRNTLIKYLQKKGIDAKIHYPKPMHLQVASRIFGYKKGDFPKSEKISNSILSLPVHEFINEKDIHYIVNSIKEFYAN